MRTDYSLMLSVTLLPPTYSAVLNLNIIAVYNGVIPFIYAFVPVGLYQIYRKKLQFNKKYAFLSAVFFMSYPLFWQQVPREQVAVLFLVLIVLLVTTDRRGPKQNALLIAFIGALTVSHYSTTYIFLYYAVVLQLASVLLAIRNRQQLDTSAISTTLVAIAACFALGWYVFTSGGAPLHALLNVLTATRRSFASEFLATATDPVISAGVGGGIESTLLGHLVAYFWQLLTEILIVVGLIFAV